MAPRKPKIVPVAEPTNICKNCKHARFGEVIYCHRFPPTPIYDAADQAVDSYFTVVGPDCYCGEFAAKLNS